MTRFVALAALVVALVVPASAQTIDVWTDASTSRIPAQTHVAEYRLMRLNEPALRGALGVSGAVDLAVPLPEGGALTLRVEESSVMAPALQARYPEIRTYVASGAAGGRLAVTPRGVTGLLFDAQGTVVVDPVAPGSDLYLVYRAKDLIVPEDLLASLGDDALHLPEAAPAPEARSVMDSGATLRTYRLAVAARGEYVQGNGGTVSSALAAIVTAVNRVNAIYERDLTLRFQLVANNDQVIYTNPATDPFTAFSSDALSQSQSTLDTVIGSANYDIGHLLGFDEGGGVAYVGAACNASIKGGGVSGVGQQQTFFELLVFPHELGHMLGAPHAFVQYLPSQPANENGVEPGPGYTIMSYGQFANGNNGNFFRPPAERIGFYFHADSIDRMNSYVRGTTGGGNACGTNAATGNDVPVVTVPSTFYTIPIGTAFRLDGSAADGSGTGLTYTWDQVNVYGSGGGAVPVYRSFDPSAETERTFPDVQRLLAGELLPDEGYIERDRRHNFRLTVRDNVGGGGAVGSASVALTVRDDDGPFEVTSQTIETVYAPGSTVPVTWSTAGTSTSTPTVDVLLTYDDGATWTTLAAATANDGEFSFTAPATDRTNGRILIQAVGNVFLAVSATPFTVGQPPVASVSSDPVEIRVNPNTTATADIAVSNAGAASSTLQYVTALENVLLLSGQIDSPLVDYAVQRSGQAGGPAVDLQDVSTTGTRLAFTAVTTYPADDDGVSAVTLPFAFPFYGSTYTSAKVSTNGMIRFVGADGQDATNAPIPTASAPDGFIAPFWDDLVVGEGGVFTGMVGDRFVVQWTNVAQYGVTASLTFQALLSPDGTVEFQYGLMTGTLAGSTVGVESADGLRGEQLAYNQTYITSSSAVRLTPVRRWLTVESGSGTVAGGDSGAITLGVDASGFPDGTTLTADVVVTTNDGSASRIVVPVTLVVTSGPIANEEAPALAEVSLPAPNPAAGRSTVRVALAAPTRLRATLHDALGREVAMLWDGPASGAVSLDVDAGRLAAGVYVVRVAGEGFVESRRLVVVR